MKTFTRSALAAAILIATTQAAAEGQESKRTFSLNKVTVAATLNEQKIEDVASSVTVIDAETLATQGATDIRDAVRYEPGVSVGKGTGDASRFGDRGFTIRGITDNRIKITVDGVDQANSFSPGGPYQRATRNYVDIDAMKLVEIVKGPASTLYGSDALGGVVAFTTKDPADFLKQGDDTAVRIKLAYDGRDSSLAETLTLANRNGNLESMLVYTHRDGDERENFDDNLVGGTGSLRTKPDPLEFDSDNVLLKLQHQINDQHRIGLTVEDYEDYTETDVQSKLENNYTDYYLGKDTIERQRVGIFHEWADNRATFDHLKWQLDRQDSTSTQDTPHVFHGDQRIKAYSHEEENLEFTAQFDKTIANHRLTYGINYEDTDLVNITDTINLSNPSATTLGRYVPLVEGNSFGVFLQNQISLLEGRLTITPGIRYDKFDAEPTTDSRFEAPVDAIAEELTELSSDKLTLRLGTVYDISDTVSLFGQYSQGFKAPDLIDMYYASYRDYTRYGRGLFLTLPNPNLEPEQSDSFELGLRLNDKQGELEVTAFYNDYESFINQEIIGTEYGGVTYEQVNQSVNVEEVEIKGLELRGALWLDEALGLPTGTSLQGSIAYAEGEDTGNNEPIDIIAPLTTVIGLSYDSSDNSWGSTLNWTAVNGKNKSDVSNPEGFTSHGYGVFDLNGYYKPVRALTLRAGVNNLFDKKYSEWEDVRSLTADAENADRYTQPGRSFIVSAAYQF